METTVLVGAMLSMAAGGIFPWISGEVVVVSAALLLPETHLPALVLGCAVTQMASKCFVYAVARWTPERLPARAGRALEKARGFTERRALLVAGILTGSVASLPPFYVVTLACGLLRVPLALFLVVGLLGNTVRYAVVTWAAVSLAGG